MNTLDHVRQFWETRSCGEVYATGDSEPERLRRQSQARYELEPYIFDFARFHEGAGRDVLEIGVGMGADHEQWMHSQPKSLTGIDLTERAVQFAKQRCPSSNFRIGDAERLPFKTASFDIVYSWGVLHHTPQTLMAMLEAYRVLRTGGVARIMIYHKWSITAFMLWAVYGIRYYLTLNHVLAYYLESPGTQAFSRREARLMMTMAGFRNVSIATRVGTGDLLLGKAGQRHQGTLLSMARRIWPRWFIQRFLNRFGLVMMIEARK